MNETNGPSAPSPETAAGGESETAGSPQSDSERRRGLLMRLRGAWKPRGGANLRDDLTDALADDGGDRSAFSPEERAMLNNILALRELRVEDVMVPRADINAIDINVSLGELMAMLESTGHSRLPVYAETLDDPRGMIHIRDVLAHVTKIARTPKRRSRKAAEPGAPERPAGSFDLSRVDLSRALTELNIVRPVLFVPPSMLASDLMARMKAARIQMALVIDEYGGTDGLVSLEDIVEMVVGDIEDEHDDDEPMITEAGDGIFIVDARAELDDLAERIGGTFSVGEHIEDVDTVGGMIFNTLGRVPVRGEVVQAVPGYEFHVLDADPRRVKRVRIVKVRAGTPRRRPAAKPADVPAEEKPAEAESPASEG
ncbi:MAG: HlyC/CorC family transporter [Notoacmeibacter sp.]|nr:HlyC/CorC family transporter [Notoacmeibacter sp.]MCC0032313.1 HlyC/CorC family transporter [Brucellaceae bacterium]